uniref:Uncharacterized protein n=1 Tax=Romanomermis culicivorax TaxID=13658 RepID=A0A915JF16_ROMCU
LTDVLPKNTPPYAFLDARQAYFSFYPFNIILKGPLDIANNQHMIRKFHDSIKEIPYIVKSDQNLQQSTTGVGDQLLFANPSVSQTGSSSQFWLQLMSEWLTDLQSKFDADFEAGLINRHGLVQNRSESVSPEAVLAYKLLCNHGDEISRNRVGNTRLVDKDGIVNPEGFYNYLTAWYYADQMTYYVSQANLLPVPPFWQSDDKLRQNNIKIPPAPIPVYSQIPYFLNKLVDTPSIIDMIIKVRGVCDEYANLGLSVFPDGIPFTFWEQYLHLKRNLLIALSVVIGAVFLVNTLLLMSVWMATLVVVILISMEIELAGFMGIVGLKLNAVSGVSLITAVGICVESTVHVALCFLTSLGSRNRRMTSTLEHVTVPVFHGGLSTLLGVVMLAFSEFEFVFRYFFMVLSALIVLGIFNGLCVFPVLLSMFGPKSEVNTFLVFIENIFCRPN